MFRHKARAMFLFTSRSNTPEPAKSETPVQRSMQSAAQATGISFDYLMRTAKRESNLNPNAKAPTSSATGLFQFIEQTWLGLVKKEGEGLGLKNESEAIQQDRSGRYVVPDPGQRQAILDMRKDPELSSRLAWVFTQKNRETLRDQLGRDPNSGELYMAHFLGAQGASGLISMAQSQPDASASKAFPDAAGANRSIFFDGKGRSRSVREVYARLASFHGGVEPGASQTAAAQPAPVEAGTRSPLAIGAPRAVGGAQRTDTALHGLFRNGGDTASAKALRSAWSGYAESRLNKNAPSFFPRSDAVQVASATIDGATGGTLSDANPPGLGAFQANSAEVVYAVEAGPLPPRRSLPATNPTSGAPLDLMKLTRPKR